MRGTDNGMRADGEAQRKTASAEQPAVAYATEEAVLAVAAEPVQARQVVKRGRGRPPKQA